MFRITPFEKSVMFSTTVWMVIGWWCVGGPLVGHRMATTTETIGMLISMMWVLIGTGLVAGSMLVRIALQQRTEEEDDAVSLPPVTSIARKE